MGNWFTHHKYSDTNRYEVFSNKNLYRYSVDIHPNGLIYSFNKIPRPSAYDVNHELLIVDNEIFYSNCNLTGYSDYNSKYETLMTTKYKKYTMHYYYGPAQKCLGCKKYNDMSDEMFPLMSEYVKNKAKGGSFYNTII